MTSGSNESPWNRNEADRSSNLNQAQTSDVGGLGDTAGDGGSQYTHTPAGPATPQQRQLYLPVEEAILGGALNAAQPGQMHYGPFRDGGDGGFEAASDSSRFGAERAAARFGQENTQRQMQQPPVPAVLYTTPSGHKRGPLNGGCVFPSTRPLPPLIPNFRPTLYTGSRATVKGTQRTQNTAGKPVQYNIYSTMADDFPGFANGYKFSYDSRGRLSDHVLFDVDTWATFLQCHPLKRSLGLFLEKNPANCKGFSLFTQDHPTYNKCRFRHCASKEKSGRGFHDGTIRIAIDEVVGRIPYGERFNNNPYFCAGYLHIDCLERMMDIGQLIRCGMLRPRAREAHPYDPHTSKTEPQVLCPPAKLVTCFEEFCKRILQYHWEGYLHNQADYLTTHAWLSVQKKGKKSTHDAPFDMKKENAQELLSRRPVDPNWGGGRRPGLAMKTVKKAEAAGKKDQLVGPGTGRDSERAQLAARLIKDEIESDTPDESYQTGEAWLRDCYIPLTNPELHHDELHLLPPNYDTATAWSGPSWQQGASVGPLAPPSQQPGTVSNINKRKRSSSPSDASSMGQGVLSVHNRGGPLPKVQKHNAGDFDPLGYLPSSPLTHKQDMAGTQRGPQNVYPPMVSPAVQSQLDRFGTAETAPQQQLPFHAEPSALSPSLREEFFPQMEDSPSQSYYNSNTQDAGESDGNDKGNASQMQWEGVAGDTGNQASDFWQGSGVTMQDYELPFNNDGADVDSRSRLNPATDIGGNGQFTGLNGGGMNSMQNWGGPSGCIDPLLLQISQPQIPPSPVDCSDLTVSEDEKRLLGEGWYVPPKGSI